jgi:hypothetical protein
VPVLAHQGVSTGARASELLDATVVDADSEQQLITVMRKATRVLQPLPVAPDAFVWLRLYQAVVLVSSVRRSGDRDPKMNASASVVLPTSG